MTSIIEYCALALLGLFLFVVIGVFVVGVVLWCFGKAADLLGDARKAICVRCWRRHIEDIREEAMQTSVIDIDDIYIGI